MELFAMTKNDIMVTLVAEPNESEHLFVKIRVDGVTLASFSMPDVWSFMKEALISYEYSIPHARLSRICYEAKNIYRLTQEWIKRGKTNEPT